MPNEDCLKISFGTSARRQLCRSIVIVAIFVGFWQTGARSVWDYLKSSSGVTMHAKKVGRGRDSRYIILLYWNLIISLTGNCKRFCRIHIFTILLLFYLFCIYWDWQGQKCNLKRLRFIRLTLNYSVCTVISACTHPCDTNTFTYSLRRTHLLKLKINKVWMEIFWNKKFFHLCIKKISTLKPQLYKLFLIKLSANVND